MKDASSRPAIAEKCASMAEYDVVYLGFPIWWYVAPTIVNAFLESYDLSGKTVVVFATSGTSGMARPCKKLAPELPRRKARRGEGVPRQRQRGRRRMGEGKSGSEPRMSKKPRRVFASADAKSKYNSFSAATCAWRKTLCAK